MLRVLQVTALARYEPVRLVLRRTRRVVVARPASVLRFVVSSVAVALLYLYVIVPADPQKLVRVALEECARDPRYIDVYRRPDRLPSDFKYLLLWNAPDLEPFRGLDTGQRVFLDYNCSVSKCYVTTDRRLLGGDVMRFDAIAFNGRDLKRLKRKSLPSARHPRQMYLYFNTESADYYPVCEDYFDDFFNMTVTYRLDSDVPYTYVTVRDARGRVIGPQAGLHWEPPASAASSRLTNRLRSKSRAAAWFVSNCRSRSGREELVERLQDALTPYGLQVDVFGQCGRLECPQTSDVFCDEMVKRDYYFYLALENSFAEDYVTEKILRAVRNNAVPVVLGGARYERFLPPGSYLDAGQLSPAALAAQMARAVRSPADYVRYFRWHNLYSWEETRGEDHVCAVCAALHAPRASSVGYANFRRWWHSDYEQRCDVERHSLLWH